jgi:hypothetical protein
VASSLSGANLGASAACARINSPIERVAEIFEAPFLKEPGLTRELLDEAGRADTGDAREVGHLAVGARSRPPNVACGR